MRPVVRKSLAILGVCLVFTLGMAAGAAVTLRVVRNRAETLLTDRGSDAATERLVRYLGGKLHCDAGQREQIAVVLRSAHGEMREVRREVAPRVSDIYHRAVVRIREGLHPDQAKTFDEMVARQVERLRLNEAPAPPASPSDAPATPTLRDQ